MASIAPRVPAVGQTAPDFTLPSSTNSPVTLSASRGSSSVDAHHALREFKAMHRMQVELLSDFKRDVSIQYLLHPERFFSNRAYFLVDKAGVIRWLHVEENPSQRRENAEILAEIAKLS